MHKAIDEVKKMLQNYSSVWGNELYLEKALAEVLVQPVAPPKPKAVPKQAPKPRLSSQKIPAQRSPELQSFYLQMKACTKCALSESRNNLVFGWGNPNANLMLIGEAPGHDEDVQGIPFVGRAGQLLDKMLLASGLKREDIYIANMLKCRPPGNRDPLPEEIIKCEPYLRRQLEIIKPKVLMALGRVAGQSLLKTQDSLSRLREQTHHYNNIPLLVTYHPAALLRNPRWKQSSWQDLKKIKKLLQNV